MILGMVMVVVCLPLTKGCLRAFIVDAIIILLIVVGRYDKPDWAQLVSTTTGTDSPTQKSAASLGFVQIF